MNREFSLQFAMASVAVLFVAPSLTCGQTPPTSAAGAASREEVASFDQEKSTCHFKLLPDGGVIEITANDLSDVATRNAIQQQVVKIAGMLTEGNFAIPMFVHQQQPPGIDTMKRLKSELSYTPENLPNGGRVRITTSNPAARNTVYDFLRFEIQEHKTGDSLAEAAPAKRKHPANNLGHDAHPARP
jgi:hypothetical protein